MHANLKALAERRAKFSLSSKDDKKEAALALRQRKLALAKHTLAASKSAGWEDVAAGGVLGAGLGGIAGIGRYGWNKAMARPEDKEQPSFWGDVLGTSATFGVLGAARGAMRGARAGALHSNRQDRQHATTSDNSSPVPPTLKLLPHHSEPVSPVSPAVDFANMSEQDRALWVWRMHESTK